ncbi:MAG: DMT family transporter [Chthoniobacteraceae bacterium]|nr:DMT family transporter [Chthoniobacteraceae bacterium]
MNAALRSHALIVASLLFAIFLWGGNNTGIKYLVESWPPIWVGGTRFVCAGLLMLGLLRWTDWLGPQTGCVAAANRRLWWGGGLGLAVYIAVFNWALTFTSASHVALYLGASPVWALLWEGRAGRGGSEYARRFVVAALALFGVCLLLWPALKGGGHGRLPWLGECLGLAASLLWVVYGRQCRALAATLSGAEVSAHTMWRAGLLLLPLGMLEIAGGRPVPWDPKLLGVQVYCILAGGVVAFGLWNRALRYWRTSEVYLFNNLIPASTMLWASFCLGEPMTSTFWLATACIAGGVTLAQANWERLLGNIWAPGE